MLQPRPPIVVILGHVDHGKTTLLDYLRKSNIASREAGGITQHIRSFQLITDHQSPVTFIDTPGHEAFSGMRFRGSKIADIAILVIAADDGVMPQTKQSIEFIRQANIPFIVAINKMDLPQADPDKVKTQLTQNNVVVEDLGGDVPTVTISAKTGQGVKDLLDLIQLMAELNPPQSDPSGSLECIVLESFKDPRVGPTVAVIVKNGTLLPGQKLYSSIELGKIRNLLDSQSRPIKSALPSTPVQILGLDQVIPVGEVLTDHLVTKPVLPTIQIPKKNQDVKAKIIIKADVLGSLEAILSSLPPQVSVILASTGPVTESDIDLAKTTPAIIVGFNVKAPASVARLAEIEHVPINFFSVIYGLLDFIAESIRTPTEIIDGKAKIIAEFKIGSDRIAGCKVTEGVIKKPSNIKLYHGDILVGTSKIKSLKTGKLEVNEIKPNQEFGLTLSPYLDFKITDSIIAFTIHGPT